MRGRPSLLFASTSSPQTLCLGRGRHLVNQSPCRSPGFATSPPSILRINRFPKSVESSPVRRRVSDGTPPPPPPSSPLASFTHPSHPSGRIAISYITHDIPAHHQLGTTATSDLALLATSDVHPTIPNTPPPSDHLVPPTHPNCFVSEHFFLPSHFFCALTSLPRGHRLLQTHRKTNRSRRTSNSRIGLW